MREKVLEEILATEKTYVKTLQDIIQVTLISRFLEQNFLKKKFSHFLEVFSMKMPVSNFSDRYRFCNVVCIFTLSTGAIYSDICQTKADSYPWADIIF